MLKLPNADSKLSPTATLGGGLQIAAKNLLVILQHPSC